MRLIRNNLTTHAFVRSFVRSFYYYKPTVPCQSKAHRVAGRRPHARLAVPPATPDQPFHEHGTIQPHRELGVMPPPPHARIPRGLARGDLPVPRRDGHVVRARVHDRLVVRRALHPSHGVLRVVPYKRMSGWS
eukprot:30928-Pelagococcus_subviridis.AAC.3